MVRPDGHPSSSHPISAEELKRRLLEDYRIEIPVIEWEGNQYIRLSVQAYNTMGEMEALIGALTSLFM